MSNLHNHALAEFRSAGWLDDNGYTDEMQGMICEHLLELLKVFDDEGHSGSTAPYTINLFKRLAMFEPIAPLTGKDDEWTKLDYGVDPKYQNKRRGSVFKDANGEVYDSDGKVFWEWYKDDDGNVTRSYYSCRDSRVPITFPYSPPDKPIYEYRHSDAEPRTPSQNEAGFL